MDILITGGTGFIGQRLCMQLLAQGHRVQVLTRTPGKPAPPGVQYVGRLDEVGPVQAVVNLAGEPLTKAAGMPRASRRSWTHASVPPGRCWRGCARCQRHRAG
jgi:uncharacterized protein YbjT (DUF2867 family)